jgi:hypothetical protein
MSDEVADKLLEAATALDDVCQLWDEDEQAAFDRSSTNIRRAWGMSLEEIVHAMRDFVAEALAADIAEPEPDTIGAASGTAVCHHCGKRIHRTPEGWAHDGGEVVCP